MKKIGLTGGIGSGKSFVAELFRRMGVPVFEADAEAKRLQQEDAELIAGMKKLFGEDIYLRDGSLDRKRVAAVAFGDKEKLAQLNALVHPAVRRAFERWLEQHKEMPLVLKEAAILFESGTDKGLDGVIVVSAPVELRIQRVMRRDGISREEVERRMKSQWPEEEKIRRAQHVITNDEKTLLLPQVSALKEKLSA